MRIWFKGDKVRIPDGREGVIEGWTYNVPALIRGPGVPGDIAHVRTDTGVALVPAADLEAAA